MQPSLSLDTQNLVPDGPIPLPLPQDPHSPEKHLSPNYATLSAVADRKMTPLPSPSTSFDRELISNRRFPTSHKPTSVAHDDTIVSLESRYRIERTLGSGAFSTVVLASPLNVSPPNTQSLKAIKMISKKFYEANDRTRVATVREVDILRKLHHPNLIHLVDYFLTPTHECLVLEHAKGGELFEFVESYQPSFTTSLCRRIASELFQVVSWMHTQNIVHRDIKLENILLMLHPFHPFDTFTSDNTGLSNSPPLSPPHDPISNIDMWLPRVNQPLVKLTDFGLSRSVDPENSLLQTRCGSEEYAAPEIIMNKAYDAKLTDSWALGVVLFAVFTGRLPFSYALTAESKGMILPLPHRQSSPSPTSGSTSGSFRVRLNESVSSTKSTSSLRDGESPSGNTTSILTASPEKLSSSGGGEQPTQRTLSGKALRKAFLMNIAKGSYEWPLTSVEEQENQEKEKEDGEEEGLIRYKVARMRQHGLATPLARDLVENLLVRDSAKRRCASSLLEHKWFQE